MTRKKKSINDDEENELANKVMSVMKKKKMGKNSYKSKQTKKS